MMDYAKTLTTETLDLRAMHEMITERYSYETFIAYCENRRKELAAVIRKLKNQNTPESIRALNMTTDLSEAYNELVIAAVHAKKAYGDTV